MELRHLRYFQAVAEELHFGRAADRLHIAQPPLSQQIRQLEQELGVALLIRNTRRVELTPAGRAYLERVSGILTQLEEAGHQASRIDAGFEGHLAIGCVGSATYSLLPQLVRSLREEVPRLEISVRGEMLVPAQVTALLAGEIDIALLRPPVEHPDIVTTALRADGLLVAVPSGHRLSTRKRLEIADLRTEGFIVHAGQGRSVMGGLVAALCSAAGFVPHVLHEVAETSTLVTLVAAGLGVAVVPAPTAELGVSGVDYVELRPKSAKVDLIAAHRRDAAMPVVDEVIAVLKRLTLR
ncbi:LysR substrate-binding domain-containing protein [Mycolicibacterium litorale]|uniref:LysR substrate-binding domain-containing protein n=1 Tax=Mycolicibacterium litorale TaxID=758802 RepID=UPI003CF31D6A